MKHILFSIVGLAAMMAAGVSAGIGDQFAANLLHESIVTPDNAGKSIVVSPASVLFPLASLSLAAEGLTRFEILRAIGSPSVNVTREVLPTLLRRLELAGGVEVDLANKIYVSLYEDLNPDFAKYSKIALGTDIEKINFGVPYTAVHEINRWVEEHTKNRIVNLLRDNDVTPQTKAIIVNAIYFEGVWQNKFLVSNTAIQNFYVSKDNVVRLPTMNGKFDLQYAESAELDAKILELPYNGLQSSLLVVLPNQYDGIMSLQEKLQDSIVLNQAIGQLKKFSVQVSLPKFKIETTSYLVDILKQMGIRQMFTGNANFPNLFKNDSNFFVSDVIQKAFIDVNEVGSKAAAATVVNLVSSVWNRPVLEERVFAADHPFMFYLRVKNDILFSGVYRAH